MIYSDTTHWEPTGEAPWSRLPLDERIFAGEIAGSIPVGRIRNLQWRALHEHDLAVIIAAAEQMVGSGDVESLGRVCAAYSEAPLQVQDSINDVLSVPSQLESGFAHRLKVVADARWSPTAVGAIDARRWIGAPATEQTTVPVFSGELSELRELVSSLESWKADIASAEPERQSDAAAQAGAVRVGQIAMLQRLLLADNAPEVAEATAAALLRSQDAHNAGLVTMLQTESAIAALKATAREINLPLLLERVVAECSGTAVGGAREYQLYFR